MNLLARYRTTGQRPTRLDGVAACTSVEELDGMVAAIGARGEELTDAERAAVAVRRAELGKGKR